MLEYINIKNVALIDEAEICFDDGLNILTGETGTGKSMIIDSVNFALGDKADKNFIRQGAEKAIVELCFSGGNEDVSEFFSKNDIPEEENILITRSINEKGRTVNKINGVSVTVAMLKELSASLIDIHGQHEHQSLLNKKKQLFILDKFCGEEFSGILKEYEDKYNRFRKIENELTYTEDSDREKEQRLDFLEFQIREIEEASLEEKEDEILAEKKKILQNSEKLGKLSGKAIDILYDGKGSVSDKISEAVSLIGDIKNIDESIKETYEALERASIEVNEAMFFLRDYFNNIELNPEELYYIDERLNLIYGLKRKYGNSIEKIIDKLNELKKEREDILNRESNMLLLKKEYFYIKEDLEKLSQKITEIRREKAEFLEKEIEGELRSLEMKNALFKINIEKKDKLSLNGADDAEFLISPNKGENLKPLLQIASGGELSRVMLALKNVLSSGDNIGTFIFDEIDTGVSGRTAQKVAEKMNKIGKSKQILCITHLPQIAAMADKHFLIEKKLENEKTITSVKDLDREGSVKELARLMGGAEITEITMSSAEEVKSQAEKIKLSE